MHIFATYPGLIEWQNPNCCRALDENFTVLGCAEALQGK